MSKPNPFVNKVNTIAKSTHNYKEHTEIQAKTIESQKEEINLLKSQIQKSADSLSKFESIPEKLEDIEIEINQLKGKMWEVSWYLGKRLIIIRENYLDKTDFKNISEYAKSKFDFSSKTTYRLMFVAANFDKLSALTNGSKLYLLEKLDEEHRQKYLDWMEKENPSFREIEQKVKSETSNSKQQNKKISLSKTVVKVDLRKMGIEIPEEKSADFLKELEDLCIKYGNN